MDKTMGKSFEMAVAKILRLSGYEVESEKLIGHKKVDLFFEERRIGSKSRIAVECKEYSHKITREELTNIYMDYRTLYQSNQIDEVLLVSCEGLSPSALTMINETREISHVTFAELSRKIMDFSQYIDFQIDQFLENGLSQYYIPARLTNGLDLESEVLKWVDRPTNTPIAILGSYGMGKTTFCRRLSNVLGTKVKTIPDSRIPIVIKLGDISSNQDLEGLLGKNFTTTSVVKNYSFDLFMQLNRLGHFVVMLDGFDEMKHTLSWEEFKFNFKQLIRLTEGNSKIVLLGRPTAFLNDDEYQFVLHGLRTFGGKILREPDWPDFNELDIAAFNREQVERFLSSYLPYKMKSENKGDKSESIYQKQISRILDKKMSDITRRPVQLKMLADVIPQWNGDIDNLTITLLYSLFIDLIIDRDQEKIARRKFGVPQRKEFAKRLALWLWWNKTEMNITPDAIPNSLILPFMTSNDDHLEAIKRDLVSACFLERKIGGSLYFPHRSFQEYLVADAICDDLCNEDANLFLINETLNDEISMFIEGLISKKILSQWEKVLSIYKGTLSWRFSKIYSSQEEFQSFLLSKTMETMNPWYPLFLTVAFKKFRFKKAQISDFLSILQYKISCADTQEQYILLCFFCILCINSQSIGLSIKKLANRWDKQVERPQNIKPGKKIEPNLYKRVYKEQKIIDLLRKISFSKKNWSVNVSGVYPFSFFWLKDYCMLSNWIMGSTIKTDDVNFPDNIILDQDIIECLENAQKTHGAIHGSFIIEHGSKKMIFGRHSNNSNISR